MPHPGDAVATHHDELGVSGHPQQDVDGVTMHHLAGDRRRVVVPSEHAGDNVPLQLVGLASQRTGFVVRDVARRATWGPGRDGLDRAAAQSRFIQRPPQSAA